MSESGKEAVCINTIVYIYEFKLKTNIKAAATDMRYFARSKFSRSLITLGKFANKS